MPPHPNLPAPAATARRKPEILSENEKERFVPMTPHRRESLARGTSLARRASLARREGADAWKWGDLVHALVSTAILAVMCLFTAPVSTCLFPNMPPTIIQSVRCRCCCSGCAARAHSPPGPFRPTPPAAASLRFPL